MDLLFVLSGLFVVSGIVLYFSKKALPAQLAAVSSIVLSVVVLAMSYPKGQERLSIEADAGDDRSAQVESISFTNEEICRAIVATLFSKPPKIIEIERVDGDVYYTSYVRPDDGKVWKNKCQFSNGEVLWGVADGRWRTHELDEKVRYSIDSGNLTIEAYDDRSVTSSSSFTKSDF